VIGKPQFSLIDNDTPMVSVTVGNKTYPPITVEKDKELIDKATKYKKSLSRKNPIPQSYLYCLWVSIYQESGYDFYLDPIHLRIFDSKWKRAINSFISSWRGTKKKGKHA
tara:strand:- start:1570 stop:1899 length:330 start_codon:yes stop_codon:yes gene_type:complete